MTISAKESVRKDLEDLFDKSEDRRRVWSAVVKAIEASKYEHLKGNLRTFYRVRVGNYRAIFIRITDGVLVTRIADRKDAYKE
jgi:mRNA-degrading endonuclease RelE of RelBE toxin-antitoxin system